jgi:hypothetical protein
VNIANFPARCTQSTAIRPRIPVTVLGMLIDPPSGCLILLLHDDKLERAVADVSELMSRGRLNIYQCSRNDVDLANAFFILSLDSAYVT